MGKRTSALVLGRLQDDKNHLSYLELSSAKPAVIATFMDDSCRFAKHKASLVIENLPEIKVDQLFVDWARWFFFQACHSLTLVRFTAAFLFKHLEFGKNGHRKIPRLWRVSKGFHWRSPARTREPRTWREFGALAMDLLFRGYLSMGILVCIVLGGPSEALGLRFATGQSLCVAWEVFTAQS